MQQEASARIPQEVLTFFSKPGGHSLIIRGEAGTGKTTLSLQLIEELAQYNNSHYLSTRVSDILLLVQFPWLGEKIYGKEYTSFVKNQVPWITGEGDPDTAHVIPRDDGAHDVGLKKLMDIYHDERRSGADVFPAMEDVNRVYDAVKGALPQRSLVVIDSLDALAERHGLENAPFITAIQKDLVEGYGANIIFVFENNEKEYDYLADASVVLSAQEHQGRTIRHLKVQKLRGCEIKQLRYLFTLKGGRVQSFGNIKSLDVTLDREWSSLSDNRGKISSGLVDLDRLLGGGFNPGAAVLYEIGKNVPMEIISLMEQSLVANFASQRRGALWLPMKRVSADTVKKQLSAAIHPNLFDKCVRIPELAVQSEAGRSNHVLRVEGADVAADLKWDLLTYSLKSADMPYLTLFGFDTLESIYGENVMSGLTEHVATLKRNGGVFAALSSESTQSNKKLIDLSTVHLKIERIDGVLTLYGEEPFTECNAVTLEWRERGGCLSLTPVV